MIQSTACLLVKRLAVEESLCEVLDVLVTKYVQTY